MLLTNAFSLNMLADVGGSVKMVRVSAGMAALLLRQYGMVSAVGHADTAALLSKELGIEVPVNRIGVKLMASEVIVVAQYRGPRLPEGTTVLPDDASFAFVVLKVMNDEGLEVRVCAQCDMLVIDSKICGYCGSCGWVDG